YVLQTLAGQDGNSPNDKLCRLLFLIAALKDADAARVTAVLPYLCYARKDRRTKPRDPITLRYVAQMFEAVGVDRVVVLDVHNDGAFDNAFRCPTDRLEARHLFADFLAAALAETAVSVVSPDAGGEKRAERFRLTLEERLGRAVGLAFIEKYRSAGTVRGGTVVGDVAGRVALIVDDLISTGTTMARGAHACLDAGAKTVMAVATHGLFVPPASDALADPAIAEVWITDSVPPCALARALQETKVTVIGCAPLLAEAIRALHEGGSILELVG
ncbi:MAG: ribose-phosphate pyrophosphokinase, partial [Alphaproteobacteria bacterium]